MKPNNKHYVVADLDKQNRERNCLNKLTFKTKDEANAAIIYADWRYISETQIRYYQCRYGNHWHLTGS